MSLCVFVLCYKKELTQRSQRITEIHREKNMKLSEICKYLDTAIPLSFQEDYDNSGLQVGFPESDISSALLTIDITEEVIDEAS